MDIKELDRKATGENIKRLMRKKGLTTLDLQIALKLNSPATIYSWTQGKYSPNADGLVRLASIFECKIDDILVLEDKE